MFPREPAKLSEALRIVFLGAGGAALFALMQAPPQDFFSSPERYYEEIAPSEIKRSISVEVKDLGSGELSVSVGLEGLKLAEICSTNSQGFIEGHAHLYVDGFKRATMYAPEIILSDMEPGEHEIVVTFSRPPTHRVLSVGGVPLSQSILARVN